MLKMLCDIQKTEEKRHIKIFGFIQFDIYRKKYRPKHKNKLLKFIDNYYYVKNYTAQLSDIKEKKFFVEDIDDNYKREDSDTKLIAFYLPQFHTIPVNDKYHGKGFTDWTNVTSAIPQYPSHYQPHLPADCGFYDLSNPEVLEKQSVTAQKYGVYGFCYHYYWFSGDRLLEKPLFDMLNNKKVTIPFCLCWANENWSKLWDGGNKELIKEQKLEECDFDKFFYDILPFFKDERYIKINNRPILVVYMPSLFKQELFKKFILRITELSKTEGFDGIYTIASNCRLIKYDFDEWGLDGIVEFPPHGIIQDGVKEIKSFRRHALESFEGKIYDMKGFIENKRYIYNTDYNLFKGVFPTWDNTARKANSGCAIFEKETPDLYKKWLKGVIDWTKENKKQEEQIVFINAWNEWAEGAHLEADRKYGYAYLKATKEALEECK